MTAKALPSSFVDVNIAPLIKQLQDPWRLGNDPCFPCEVHRKNCPGNPRCVYGFGEGVKGMWGKKPPLLAALGADPELNKRDPRVVPAGLINLGATCYLASLLQTLFLNLKFRAAVYAWIPPDDAELRELFELACKGDFSGGSWAVRGSPRARRMDDCKQVAALQRIFAFLQGSHRRSVSPKEWAEVFEIPIGDQQDAQVRDCSFCVQPEVVALRSLNSLSLVG